MLEKIGLPAKPSLRGNNWVVDASHCQGCSSQFTFINRKHHCRRCGGIFCNSCTQHRMILRGQGDSPVRTCEPCKKLEEAARFELRHGHRSKTGKGSSNIASRNADEVLNQILTTESKDSLHMGSGKEVAIQNEDEGLLGYASNCVSGKMGSISPEELRQQSVDERNKYKILKGEGKAADALKAFKRAKEFERQAAALELQLRKNRKKALASSSVAGTQKNEDISLKSSSSVKSSHQKVAEKDDLTSELKELGWSDADIIGVEKKPAQTSLEGELLNLIGQESRKASSSEVSVDKSEVVAMKKKALALKREGKFSEAKEELKRAKILEKQLEEQELLAVAEDSDDELSALIRSLDNDKQKDFSAGFNLESGLDLDLSNYGADFSLDMNFEVTDDDMHDPEIASTLQSLGWDEEPMQPDESSQASTPVDREALASEILNLKKEAVSQKRAGNMAEAMSLLKKAKALEKDLNSLDTVNTASDITHDDGKASKPSINARTTNTVAEIDRKRAPKSRLMIQKELLALKKKALALRREGKLEEADEELKKGKFLEQQLEEMDNAPKTNAQMNVRHDISVPENQQFDLSSAFAPADQEGDVNDQDLHDPTYLALLRNLGWQDDDKETTMPSTEVAKEKAEVASVGNTDTSSATIAVGRPRRSKAEIQRELLGLKRKALALRRQGQETEAEEVLVAAKALEEQMAEIEASNNEVLPNISQHKPEVEALKQDLPVINHPIENEAAAQIPLKRPAEANDDSEERPVLNAAIHDANSTPSVSPENKKNAHQQEILAYKRKALALKREGKLAEAREELRRAKLLEINLEETKPKNPDGSIAMDSLSSPSSSSARESPPTSASQEEQGPSHSPPKPFSSHERFKLQRECLTHKRNALKLRREGKTEEADSELELAKKLEAQLEEVSPHESSAPKSSEVGPAEDASVEDFLDPQLLSALKAIGLQDAGNATQAPVKSEISTQSSNQDKAQLEAQIKAEKMKALNLKRAGKQAEALDSLRRAKQMEKKLASLAM